MCGREVNEGALSIIFPATVNITFTNNVCEAVQGRRRLIVAHPTAGRVVGGGRHVHFWQHWLLTHRRHHKVLGVCWLWARTPWLARQYLQEELRGPGPSEACLALSQHLPPGDTLTITTVISFQRVVHIFYKYCHHHYHCQCFPKDCSCSKVLINKVTSSSI